MNHNEERFQKLLVRCVRMAADSKFQGCLDYLPPFGRYASIPDVIMNYITRNPDASGDIMCDALSEHLWILESLTV